MKKNTSGKPTQSHTSGADTDATKEPKEVAQVPEVQHLRKDEDGDITESKSAKEETRTLNVQILVSQDVAVRKLADKTDRSIAATVRLILDHFFLTEKDWLAEIGALPDRLNDQTVEDYKRLKGIGNQ